MCVTIASHTCDDELFFQKMNRSHIFFFVCLFFTLSLGPSINYVSIEEGGRGQQNAHGCSRGGRGCI